MAQGQPKTQVRTLAPREVEAAGFLPGTVVQQRADGSLNVVQSPNNNASPRKAEADLRKEFNSRQEVKDFREVGSAYRNVKAAAANPSAAGDLSMIFAYMKMLDPGSVVREQEFANAQNAAGVPDRVRNAYNKALRGERLNPNQRADFIGQAEALYNARRGRFETIAGEYRGYADDYGVNPDRVVTVDREPARSPVQGAKQGQNGKWYIEDPNKKGSFPELRQGNDGAWYIKSANGKTLKVED